MLASSVAGTGVADVIEFFDEDREEWFAVTRAVTTIDFTGFPNDTFITNQYEDLGVLFLDGDDNIICCGAACFPQDGSGLDGNQAIHLLFDSPQRWIAADFPGFLQFELRFQGDLIYESSWFGHSGCGNFGGLLLTEPFDETIVQGERRSSPLRRSTCLASPVAIARRISVRSVVLSFAHLAVRPSMDSV